eukprot:SAG31_NODE_694_length_12769_cov_8.102447_18_plen_83_part_00
MAVTKMMKFRQNQFKGMHQDTRKHQADRNAGGLCQIIFLTALLILIVKPQLFVTWWEYGPVRRTFWDVAEFGGRLLGNKEDL